MHSIIQNLEIKSRPHRFDPRTIQLVAIRYTDYTIPALRLKGVSYRFYVPWRHVCNYSCYILYNNRLRENDCSL
jgi:hypothetical protein